MVLGFVSRFVGGLDGLMFVFSFGILGDGICCLDLPCLIVILLPICCVTSWFCLGGLVFLASDLGA